MVAGESAVGVFFSAGEGEAGRGGERVSGRGPSAETTFSFGLCEAACGELCVVLMADGCACIYVWDWD
jgi:hypothetical protein